MLLIKVTTPCRRKDIDGWLDFGSLIGIMRFKGEGDRGMTMAAQQKKAEICARLNKQ